MSMERRTFVKGAAWSVPIIAVAAATPLAAASEPVGALRFNGTPKHSKKGEVKFSVHNDSKVTAKNVVVTVVWTGGSEQVTKVIPLGDVSKSGQTKQERIQFAKGTVTLTVSSDNVPGETITVVLG